MFLERVGKIFIFEGLPGAGKSRVIKELSKKLKVHSIGEILDKNGKEISAKSLIGSKQEVYLENDLRKIKMATRVKREKSVLMDRSYLSTIAYNLLIKKNNPDIIKRLEMLDKKYSKDVVHIYLEITVTESMNRKNRKFNVSDNLWTFKKNLMKIKKFYEDTFRNRKNVIVINASRDYKEVFKEVYEKISLLDSVAE